MTDQSESADKNSQQEAWLRLRGSMKDIFAELGGGEAYRQEREDFNRGMERREALIAEAMGLPPVEPENPKDES